MSEYITLVRQRHFFDAIQRKPVRVVARRPGRVVVRLDGRRVTFDTATRQTTTDAFRLSGWRLPETA